MSESFGAEYAASYDALYADKDYDGECDLLEAIFAQAGRPVHTVLDLGCGTGAHAIRLAKRGFDVVGVDLSDGMLEGARRRYEASGSGNASFIRGDIRTLRLERQFDAAICMFAVLGYQTRDQDVAHAIETVRIHLAPGGPFVFDVWWGPAVEATRPSARVKVVTTANGELERQVTAVMQPDAHLCRVFYRLVSRIPGIPESVTDEVHEMRYFFEDELRSFLGAAGLRLQHLAPFPDTKAPLSATSWNVLATSQG